MSKQGLSLGLGIALLGALVAAPVAEAEYVGHLGHLGRPSISAPHRVITAQATTPAPRPAPAPRVPNSRASRSWMPALGNLAAGGMLGALFGGNVLFGILMVALLVAIGVYVVRLILRARSESMPAAQFAGLGSETVAAPPPSQAAGLNEAATAAPATGVGPKLPEGFDLPAFLRSAKLNFVRLQIASDLGNLGEIREFATPEMYAALGKGVVGRGVRTSHTDVVSLNADLSELSTEGGMHRASVRFSGMARATPGAAPAGFAEIWHLARPADGSTGWLLTGIQQVD